MQCRWRYKGDARDVLSFNGYSSRAASQPATHHVNSQQGGVGKSPIFVNVSER